MKRLISLVMLAAMLFSIPVMPIPTQAAEETLCTCGCGRTEAEINWKPWTVNDTGAPADGHYYLEDNYAQNAQHTIMAGDRVVIDLRGKTLTTKNYGRLFLVYGYLAVLDSVGGGRMCSKTSGAAFGGVVMVGMNETADPTFALHSGTLTVDPDNKSSRNGGLISVGAGCHFKMYGGTLLGGRTTERGGAIHANNVRSNVEILGGSILDCSADVSGGAIFSYGTVKLKDCVISSGEAKLYGGNLYQEGGALTVENAVIEHGVSHATTNGGGNIYALGSAQVTIKNSTIRNGYAAANGGNLCFGTCTQTLENVSICGGSAAKKGANLYVNDSNASTTIKGGEIAGDVHYANAALTLQGAVKIGINSGALKLGSGTLIDASGLTEGAEVYVDAEGTFTKSGADAQYFKPAFRTVLSTAEGQLVGTQAASGAVGGYCPHCGEIVTWTAVSDTPAGHCYLTGNLTPGAAYHISSETVLDLRGYSITSSDRAFAVASGAQLTLMDSVGGATVKGSGNSANPAGGVIYNTGTLNLYGGNYIYVAGKTVTTGGVVHNDGNMTVHGGILDGSAFQNTNEGAMGAALCVSAGERSFTMTAGHVIGGKAYRGGTACFGNNNTVNVTGGTFLGGTAQYAGGSIRLDGTSGRGNAIFSGVAVKNGNAEASSAFGGSISISYYNVTLMDSLLTGGNAGNYGGNISFGTHAYLTAKDSVLFRGTSPKGGNVYGASYLCGADFTDCLLTGGQAGTGSGGNIMINHGNFNFIGGEISYGTAAKGGNVFTNGGNYNHADADNDGFRLRSSQKSAPIVTTGTATGNGGNIYSSGHLVLDAAFIQNGKAANGKDIYYDKGANRYSLTVGSGLTGEMNIAIPAALISGTEIVNATGVPFPGKLILEGDYGQPALTVKDGKLVIGGIAVIRPDGQVDWFAEATDAVENCPEGGYVKLFTDAQVTVQSDCYIDLNGKTLTASGSGTVYGMDSSGDDYSVGTGKLIPGADIRTELRTVAPNGRNYIAIAEGDAVTYHRLGNELTDVTLRTSNCGVYYKGVWGCDSVLGEWISDYGVAVSLAHMPGVDFETDATCLWTQYDGAELRTGEKASGVAITNIMKDSLSVAANARRGEMKVYASAYVKLTDGTVLVSDQPGTDDDVAYSLHSAMDRLDSLISENPTLYRRYTKDARAFYLQWQEKGMNDWSFVNLEQPEEDDVIEVLMIGSSFCYYYVEELHALAAAAGIKMRVCNVYYSGCRLDQHYNWWVGNESKYQFFVTDENGRRQYNNVSLEYCLAQGNWDVISLQESSSSIRNDGGAQNHFVNSKRYTDALIPYLQSEFPDADVYWHQTWAYQVGYNRNGYQMTSLEQQERDMNEARNFALLICQEYGIERINSGEAWQIVRRGGYDNLCARLAVNNGEGDYYHEGDIGGGQYLNGCVWFEVLTGLSCVGNTYVPDYALDPALIPTLQNAAHQAVQALQE